MRAIAVAAIVTLALPVVAQDVDDVGSSDSSTNDAPMNDVPAEPAFGGNASDIGDSGGGQIPAPEAYLVRPGDTLWNLSQRFLNNPWYWPKIWSYNQQLDNPNWIYPGSQIRFYPGSDTPLLAEPEPDDEPDFDELAGGGFEGDGIGERFNNLGADRRRREFFVPSERLDEAGQVLNSPEEKQLLSTNDRVYVKLKKQGQPGDVLQIFQPGRELYHPVTGARLGRMVELLGQLRVDQLSRDQALGTVTESWSTIERGVYVGELPIDSDILATTDNEKNIKGYVVDAGARTLSFVGDNYMVILDKGTADGVKNGNVFTVVRAGDPYTKQYSGMADEDVGEIVIIEANKNVSSGLLIKAAREVVPGDRAEMRVAR